MNLTSVKQALELPHGTLEVVRVTPTGKICSTSSFSEEDVLDMTNRLLHSDLELVDVHSQAEIIALGTNFFGWKEYREAYAV